MNGDENGNKSGMQEILLRWRRHLLILLPTVAIALVVGVVTENWLIPVILIPLLVAPLAVAVLFRNAQVPKSPQHLVYQGPLENGRLIREALGKEGIQNWDLSDQDMGSQSGSGGQLQCVIYVDRAKAEEAYKTVQRIIEEHPELFREPPAQV